MFFWYFFYYAQTSQAGQLQVSHALPVSVCVGVCHWALEKDWGFWGETFSYFSRKAYLMLQITCDHMLATQSDT